MASCCAIGLSSVEATNVLRICAVRAMRSALLACLPLLAGLRRFELIAEVFDVLDLLVEVAVGPVFDFVPLAPLDLPPDDLLLVEAAWVAEEFFSSELCPAIEEAVKQKASTDAAHSPAGRMR